MTLDAPYLNCDGCRGSLGRQGCPTHRDSATYADPTQAGRYEWTGSTLVLTHCIHGLDLRLYPRCYLCRPADQTFSTGGNTPTDFGQQGWSNGLPKELRHDDDLRRMEEADRCKDEVVAAAKALRPYIDGAESPLTAVEVQRAVERFLAALDALWRVEVQP